MAYLFVRVTGEFAFPAVWRSGGRALRLACGLGCASKRRPPKKGNERRRVGV